MQLFLQSIFRQYTTFVASVEQELSKLVNVSQQVSLYF